MNNLNYFIKTSQGKIALWDSKPKVTMNFPKVLFLHGHCTNKTFFGEQIKSIVLADYRLISIDLPRYGESDPPKILKKFTVFQDLPVLFRK